jgi:hypothetical protein
MELETLLGICKAYASLTRPEKTALAAAANPENDVHNLVDERRLIAVRNKFVNCEAMDKVVEDEDLEDDIIWLDERLEAATVLFSRKDPVASARAHAELN